MPESQEQRQSDQAAQAAAEAGHKAYLEKVANGTVTDEDVDPLPDAEG